MDDKKHGGFEYVLEQNLTSKVVFGSGKERVVNGDYVGYLKNFEKDTYPEIGPGHYDCRKALPGLPLLFRIRSKKGYPPLANESPRWPPRCKDRKPSPPKYADLHKWDDGKRNKIAFNRKAPRKTIEFGDNPGVGLYNVQSRKCRRTRVKTNFGSPEMEPHIECNCVVILQDRCEKCHNLCNGDYWQKNHQVYLCHLCWLEETHKHEYYSKEQLKQYKKIRNCGYKHRHENTDHPVYLIPFDTDTKKLRLENYLDNFDLETGVPKKLPLVSDPQLLLCHYHITCKP